MGETEVIVINGGSSSGKSTIARCLQAVLPRPWLRIGVDDLVEALPPAMLQAGSGIEFGSSGQVTPGAAFRELEAAWLTGIAAIVRAGAPVIIDDVFLGGAVSQQRTRDKLDGLSVLWVGVRCEPWIAAERELARGDRTAGMAALQADMVHDGVLYDLEVDTSYAAALDCARAIAARVV